MREQVEKFAKKIWWVYKADTLKIRQSHPSVSTMKIYSDEEVFLQFKEESRVELHMKISGTRKNTSWNQEEFYRMKRIWLHIYHSTTSNPRQRLLHHHCGLYHSWLLKQMVNQNTLRMVKLIVFPLQLIDWSKLKQLSKV